MSESKHKYRCEMSTLYACILFYKCEMSTLYACILFYKTIRLKHVWYLIIIKKKKTVGDFYLYFTIIIIEKQILYNKKDLDYLCIIRSVFIYFLIISLFLEEIKSLLFIILISFSQ